LKQIEVRIFNDEQVNLLWFACKNHNDGIISDNVTIGTCFDSDRIELIRCGMVPKPSLMSTKPVLNCRDAEKLYNFSLIIK
jgi:hypothetical protein